MKVYNQDKTQILENYNLDTGFLQPDTIEHYYPEVQAVKEEGHYVTVREYPETGGKDVEWIVDVPGVEYQPERTEIEEIYVYIPYTQHDYNELRINELKELLATSDYKFIKHAEGELTDEEYASIKEQRRAWRAEINRLEEEVVT